MKAHETKQVRQDTRELWDRPAIGLEPWFDKYLWPIYPRHDGRELALQELRYVFDGVPEVSAKKKLAFRIVMRLRDAVKLWRGIDPSVLQPLHGWVRDRGWGPVAPRFASLCTEAMRAGWESNSTPIQLAACFRPFTNDPEIGQACREMVAMLELDGDHWRRPDGSYAVMAPQQEGAASFGRQYGASIASELERE